MEPAAREITHPLALTYQDEQATGITLQDISERQMLLNAPRDPQASEEFTTVDAGRPGRLDLPEGLDRFWLSHNVRKPLFDRAMNVDGSSMCVAGRPDVPASTERVAKNRELHTKLEQDCTGRQVIPAPTELKKGTVSHQMNGAREICCCLQIREANRENDTDVLHPELLENRRVCR
eukprot:c19138_g1_i1 orf=169-699(-)